MFKSEPPILTDENNIHYLTNLDVPGRPANMLFIVAMILAGTLSAGTASIYQGQTGRGIVGIQLFFLTLVLISWLARKFLSAKPHNILSPDTLFLAFFCVFHFAYIALYALNMAPWEEEIFWSPEKVLPAINFCIWCVIIFLLGYEIAGNHYSRYAPYPIVEKAPGGVLFLSKILVSIGVLLFFASILTLGVNRVLGDYKQMTSVGATSPLGRLFWFGQNMAMIGVALYCAASGMIYKKHMVGLFMFVTWFYILSVLALGDRGGFIQLFVIPLIAFHYFQKRIKLRWILLLTVIVLSGMAVIGLARSATFGNFIEMYQQYKTTERSRAYNPVVYSLIEFGSSIKTVVIAMDLVPEKHDYWLGKSYVDGMSVAVPNVIPGMIRMSEGIVAWLTQTAFGSSWATYGRGGSIAMEAYVNFGYFGGILFFGFLGFTLRCIYERVLVHPTFLRTAFLLGVMAGYALWMRNSFASFVRPAFWTVLVAYIFLMFTRSGSMPVPEYPETADSQELYE